MIFIGLEQTDAIIKKVEMLHMKPLDPEYGIPGATEESLAAIGLLVNSIPEADTTNNPGKRPVLCYDSEQRILFYQYEEIPKSKEQLMLERIAQLEMMVADLYK